MEIHFVYLIIYFMEAFIFGQYCRALFIPQYRDWITLTALLTFYTVLFFLSSYRNFWFNALSFLTINFLFILLMYKGRCLSALFHAAVTTIIMGVSELIIMGILSRLATSFYEPDSHFRNAVVLAVCSKLIYFLILRLLSQIFNKTAGKKESSSPELILLTMIPFVCVWIMLTLFTACSSVSSPFLPEKMIVISGLMMLFLNVLVGVVYNHTQKWYGDYTHMQIQLQKENDYIKYYEMLLQQNENQNILIHDIKKHLQSISLLNNENSADKVATYIDRLLQSPALQNSFRICDREILNSILCRYRLFCKENGIIFRTDIRSNTLDFMEDDNLTSLFCNLMDNAIESASKQSNSHIELVVTKRLNTDTTVLTMVNSCHATPFSTSGKLTTHKSNPSKHGYGMKSIEKIVEYYRGHIEIYYKETDCTFHTIITLRSSP